MSIPKKTSVNCPKCKFGFTTITWDSINTDHTKDAIKKVIDGSFFDTKCPKCGNVAHLEYDVLYHDMEHEAMVWVVHGENEEKFAENARQTRDNSVVLPGYKTRIVRDVNELREKAAAFLAGKDDRVIEICKTFIKYQLLGENADFQFRNAFYTYIDGKDIVFLYDINGKELSCYLDPTLYSKMKEAYSKPLGKLKENYGVYDSEWAEAFWMDNAPEEFFEDEPEETVNEQKKERNNPPIPIIENARRFKVPNKTEWLKKNPFFMLRVSSCDVRRKIIAAADEMSFLLDADECAEYQNILLNPAKRLSAEMDWFLDSEELAGRIRERIEANLAIPIQNLGALSTLNALLYNFSLSQDIDCNLLTKAIMEVDRQYSAISVGMLTSRINLNRVSAKFVEASEPDVSFEYRKKRERIRTQINERLLLLNEQEYIKLITLLAEMCIANESYDDGVILLDIIDQYELRMQAEIEKLTARIEELIQQVKATENNEQRMPLLERLIERICAWDKLVQPLQLRSKASGMPHSNSESMGRKIRALALDLNNEKHDSKAALQLVDKMRVVFEEIGDYGELFKKDAEELRKLIRDNERTSEVLAELEGVSELAKSIKVSAVPSKTDELISKLKNANAKLKVLDLDTDTKKKIRENLCYTVREVAIYLHNDLQRTEDAVRIARVLSEEFGDILDLREKLIKDLFTLQTQLDIKRQNEAAEKKKMTGCLVWIVIIALFFLWGQFSDTSKKSTTSSTAVHATAAPATRFYAGSNTGSRVYADIVSIWPAIGIYTENSSIYSHFACECQTSSGTKVWVYMTANQYKSYFDSNVSTSVRSNASVKTVTYSTPKRINGVAKRADSIMNGLSEDTGLMLISFSSIGY